MSDKRTAARGARWCAVLALPLLAMLGAAATASAQTNEAGAEVGIEVGYPGHSDGWHRDAPGPWDRYPGLPGLGPRWDDPCPRPYRPGPPFGPFSPFGPLLYTGSFGSA